MGCCEGCGEGYGEGRGHGEVALPARAVRGRRCLQRRVVLVRVALHAALHVALHVAIGPRRRQAPYSEGAIRDLFAAAICRRDEGLMVKRADSRYVPNSRLLWAKLKRVHIPGLGDSISLALIGGRLAADGAR